MQQLDVHDYYELGKRVAALEKILSDTSAEDGPFAVLAYPLFHLRWHLQAILTEPCALLPASQRAANVILRNMATIVPDDFEHLFGSSSDRVVDGYHIATLHNAMRNFETVFKNDLPEMSTFAVAQIGIYRTEDLINRAYLQIPEDLRDLIVPLAHQDLVEAGKCLAFRVPTAAAFHLSRAIETGINQYYEALNGSPFDLSAAAKNWSIKTEALKKSGADSKITEFLSHIRQAYRNPITHPDVILEPHEAFGYFSQAVSIITMMLAEVKELLAAVDTQLSLPDLAITLEPGEFEDEVTPIPLPEPAPVAKPAVRVAKPMSTASASDLPPQTS